MVGAVLRRERGRAAAAVNRDEARARHVAGGCLCVDAAHVARSDDGDADVAHDETAEGP